MPNPRQSDRHRPDYKPPKRRNKKAMTAYVDPSVHEAIVKHAKRNNALLGDTLQRAYAEFLRRSSSLSDDIARKVLLDRGKKLGNRY
jgi:hypothetical protein